MKKGLTITLIVLSVLIIVFFIWAFGFSSKDSLEEDKVKQSKSDSKSEQALSLKKDKQERQEEANEDNEESEGKNDDKPKKKNDTEVKKQLEKDSTYVVEALSKSQNDLNKTSTQANIKDAVTKEFKEKYFDEGKTGNDKFITEIKNPKLKIDNDKDLKKDKVQGTLTYDQLQKPKDKKDKSVKPSTDIDKKTIFWFKKEDGKFKVNKFER